MNRYVQFLGIAGFIAIVFGILTALLIATDEYYIVPLHFITGLILVALFAARGGFRYVRGAALRRTAGFGAGVTIYSSLFVGVLIVLNYLAVQHELFYFDSTEDKVFTLSSQTTQVLDTLPEPVSIRAFYVGGLVASQETERLLDQVARRSENLTWELIDPEKQPILTEKFGIHESGTLHFSFTDSDTKRVVKISRDITESAIVSAILKLTRGGAKTIYYVQGHGEPSLSDTKEQGYFFLQEAVEGDNFRISGLKLNDAHVIPPDAAALVIASPRRGYLPVERTIIDEYLRRGGSAVLMHEPNTTDEIRNLVKPLGVEVGQDVIVDQVMRLFDGPSLGVEPMVSAYAEHGVTNGFTEGTVFSIAASVRKKGPVPEGSQVTEFAFTSKNSWAEQDVKLLFSDSPEATKDGADVHGPVSLAAAFEGVFRTDEDGRETPDTKKRGESETSRIVVFGDADFVTNGKIRQMYNRDLFLNALNWVVGEDTQVSIRPRTFRESAQGISAKQFSAMFLLTAILLPEGLLLGGFGMWWFRRQ